MSFSTIVHAGLRSSGGALSGIGKDGLKSATEGEPNRNGRSVLSGLFGDGQGIASLLHALAPDSDKPQSAPDGSGAFGAAEPAGAAGAGGEGDGGMTASQATITLAAYMKQDMHADSSDWGKNSDSTISRKDLEVLQNDPKVTPQVRQAASYYLNNPAVFDAVDGANTGTLDGKIDLKNLESFAENGAQTDPGQDAALQLGKYMQDNKIDNLGQSDLQTVLTDPNATDSEKSAAQYFLDNPKAFTAADGINTKGQTDGLVNAADLSAYAQTQINTPAQAVSTLYNYLNPPESVGQKIAKIFKDIGLALAGAALAFVPGVGEVADAALAGGAIAEGPADTAGAGAAAAESATAAAGDGAADAAAEGGAEGAGEAGGLAQRAGNAAIKELKSQAKDQIKQQVENRFQNSNSSQQQPLTGKSNGGAVNLAGLQQMANDPSVPLAVRNAVTLILNTPGLFQQLDGDNTNGQTDGIVNSNDLKTYMNNADKQVSQQESSIRVNA